MSQHKKTKIKPISSFDTTNIDIESFKELIFENKKSLSYTLLFKSPFYASGKEIQDLIKTKFNQATKEDLIKKNNQKDLYIINYYINDPKETEEDKIKIIKESDKIPEVKKYIYSFIDKKETKNIKLSDEERFYLILGTNEKVYFNILTRKPYYKKYYTLEGIKKVEKIFKSIIPSNNQKGILPNTTKEYKLYSFLSNEATLKYIADIVKDDERITDYKCYLESIIKDFNYRKKVISNKKDISTKYLKDKIEKENLTFEKVKDYALNKFNAKDIDILMEAQAKEGILNHFIGITDNTYKEDIDIIEDTIYKKNSKLSYEDSCYTLILYHYILEMALKSIDEAINKNENDLKEINNKDSESYYFNEKLKEILNPNCFIWSGSKIYELEQEQAQEKGLIITPNNQVINNLCEYALISNKPIKSNEKKEEIIKRTNLYKTRLNDIQIEIDTINEDKKTLSEEDKKYKYPKGIDKALNDLEEEKKGISDYIYSYEICKDKEIKNLKVYERIYNKNLVKSIKEDESVKIIEYPYFNLSIHKSITYTKVEGKNRKQVESIFNTNEIDPKINEKIKAFLTLVNLKAIAEKTRDLYIPTEEIKKYVGLKDDKIALNEIRKIVAYLSDIELTSIKLSKSGEQISQYAKILQRRGDIIDPIAKSGTLHITLNEEYYKFLPIQDDEDHYSNSIGKIHNLNLSPVMNLIYIFIARRLNRVSLNSDNKAEITILYNELFNLLDTYNQYSNDNMHFKEKGIKPLISQLNEFNKIDDLGIKLIIGNVEDMSIEDFKKGGFKAYLIDDELTTQAQKNKSLKSMDKKNKAKEKEEKIIKKYKNNSKKKGAN